MLRSILRFVAPLAVVVLGALTPAAANQIANGDFSAGLPPWQGFASTSGTFVVIGGEAQVSSFADNTNLQLYQDSFSLMGATTYKLSFRARSNHSKSVRVAVHDHVAPYTNFGLAKDIALTPLSATYTVLFTTTPGDKDHARFAFELTNFDAAGDVWWFDDVVLEVACGNGVVDPPLETCDDANLVNGDGCENDCTLTPVCGDGIVQAPEECDDGNLVDGDGCQVDCTTDNLFKNGDFSLGNANWKFFSNAPGNTWSIVNGSACVYVTDPATNLQIWQTPIALQGEEWYVVKLNAQATPDSTVGIFLHKHTPPVENYGLKDSFVAGAAWSPVVRTFRATPGNKTDGRFRIWYAPYAVMGSQYCVDDLVLQHVRNILVNPTIRPLAPWKTFFNGVATVTTSSTGGAKIDIATQGTNMQLYQKDLAIAGDTDYVLYFEARNANNRSVAVKVAKDETPFTNYGLDQVVALTNDFQTFELPFHSTAGDKTDARLVFQFGPYDLNGTEYQIRNVLLSKKP